MSKQRELVRSPHPYQRANDEEETNSDLESSPHIQIAATPRAASAYEALMQAVPGGEPDLSQGELLHLRDVIQDALDEVLNERERYIFDAISTERVSVRQVAKRLSLSKSQTHRLYQRSCKRVAAHLIAVNPGLAKRFS